jgi:hypothetical protein
MAIGETTALGGDAIDVRSSNAGSPIAANVTIPQIINIDHDNIWMLRTKTSPGS